MTQPLRYRLDDLGWYQFETLIQAVLKAELGIGVEAWGGRGDHGRDAFCPDRLAYPSRHELSEGPFVFQAKFVEEANAAGAAPGPILKRAVIRELERIERRVERIWTNPRQFILVTNAPVQAGLRKELQDLISSRLGSHSSILAGGDVCALLEAHPHMRRSFPQLLGLGDLNALLSEAVGKVVLERSRAAVESARDLVPVFVPTWAYDRTWEVLHKHRFVVLEGPPEMGKTAIAWMVGLAQLVNGWQVIDCNGPGDFFQQYDADASQLFVADDAFGRTEYDPTRASEWERHVSKVLRSLDGHHWLAWTTRRHIIERAMRTLDIQGVTQEFPDPAAVTVDAANLSESEKALMLYRHARAEGLSDDQKRIVRTHASAIVKDKHFTPERIRRFVRERLKELAATGGVPGADLQRLVLEEIRDPTDRMRKTFRALPEAHRWLLVAQVDAAEGGFLENLKASYTTLCPMEQQLSFEDTLEELSESFLRVYEMIEPSPVIDWAHPSYRDLVVEELARSSSMRFRFLARMSERGVSLALSDAGGATGTRNFPLLQDDGSWIHLTARCRELLDRRNGQVKRIFAALLSAIDASRTEDERRKLGLFTQEICLAAKMAWDKNEILVDARLLTLFAKASLTVQPLPALPALDYSWASAVEDLDSWIESAESHPVEEASAVTEWLSLVSAIMRFEPRFLSQQQFPDAFGARVDSVLEMMRKMANLSAHSEMTRRELREVIESIESLQEAAAAGARLTWRYSNQFATMEHSLGATLDEFVEFVRVDDDDLDHLDSEHGDEVTIEQLFSDL
jgi:hypothetical protein